MRRIFIRHYFTAFEPTEWLEDGHGDDDDEWWSGDEWKDDDWRDDDWTDDGHPSE